VFTANMTGNVVLLGFGIAGSGGLPVVAPIISLAAFLLGAGVGGVLVRRLSDRHAALMTSALGIEAALIAGAAVLAAAGSVRPGNAAAYALIALMALAMGVRNAAVRHIAVPDLTTTVLTMTLTGLAADSRPAGGSGQGSVRRLTAVLTMLAGALCGGLLLKTHLFAPLALAAVLALATWLVYVPARTSCDPCCGWVKPIMWKGCSTRWTRASWKPERCAPPWPPYGFPAATRRRRR
jgi:uncharacterized membrane protein YoaK (UPF0700 family)